MVLFVAAFANPKPVIGSSGNEMPKFAYSAVGRDGSVVSGDVVAASESAALDQIGRQGMTPISIAEGGQSGPWWSRDVSLFGSTGKLPLSQQAHFFQMLSTMLNAQFALPRALAFCRDQARDARLKRTLDTVSADVEGGGTLEGALEAVNAFEPRYVTMIQLGEKANQLGTVVGELRDMVDAELRNTRQLRQALFYPMILLVMSLAVFCMLVFFLAPTLVPVFTSAGIAPPALLQTLDTLGRFLSGNAASLALVAGAVILAAILFKSNLKSALARLLSTLPGIKPVVIAQQSLRFCQTLRLMLASGARLPNALETAAETAGDPMWRSKILEAKENVEAGGTLAAGLQGTTHLNDTAKAFLQAGEESDQLGSMLKQACEVLEFEVSTRIAQAIRLLTPALTMIIGLSIAFLIFSTISAILDLNDIAA